MHNILFFYFIRINASTTKVSSLVLCMDRGGRWLVGTRFVYVWQGFVAKNPESHPSAS